MPGLRATLGFAGAVIIVTGRCEAHVMKSGRNALRISTSPREIDRALPTRDSATWRGRAGRVDAPFGTGQVNFCLRRTVRPVWPPQTRARIQARHLDRLAFSRDGVQGTPPDAPARPKDWGARSRWDCAVCHPNSRMFGAIPRHLPRPYAIFSQGGCGAARSRRDCAKPAPSRP